jgi:cytochrome c oxidase subunit 4
MSSNAQAASHGEATATTYLWVWLCLVGITGIEVFLAYEHLRPDLMLTMLIGLSIIKAALIMAYFMHLKFEKFTLVLWLVPALVFCICMLLIFFFPDSLRLLHMRPR